MNDVIVTVRDSHIERVSMHNAGTAFLMLEEGMKIEAESITESIGGGAINVAMAHCKLGGSETTGAQVMVCGKIGDDLAGQQIRRKLDQAGISTQWLSDTAEQATGSSIIVTSHTNNASVFAARGANTQLTMADLPTTFESIDLVYISSLSNQSSGCFAPLAERAHKAGCFVASNPGIRQLLTQGEQVKNTLRYVDLLSINRVEGAALLPLLMKEFMHTSSAETPNALGALEQPQESGPSNLLLHGLHHRSFHMELKEFFSRLHQSCARFVCITDGANGAWLSDGKNIYHQPPAPVQWIAATVGAGDAFCATLAHYLVRGDIPLAMKAAAINAASVLQYTDTHSGLMTADAMAGALQHAVDPEVFAI